jgi:imidazolonepropionase-like amidohydrolase
MRLSLPYVLSPLLALLVPVAGPSGLHAPRPPGEVRLASVTAFVDVTVVPMDQERVLPHETVLVAGGRITALGPVGQVSISSGAVRVDGRGKFLIPGLSDMHAHAGNSDTAQSERSLALWAANGVTTIRNVDYGGTGDLMLRLRARAEAGAIVSPRIYTSGGLLHESDTPQESDPQYSQKIAAKVAAY